MSDPIGWERKGPVPWNPGAEQQAIGTSLLHQDVAEWITENATPDAFYHPQNVQTVAAIANLVNRGDKVDPVSVHLEAQAQGFQAVEALDLLAAQSASLGRSTVKKAVAEVLDCATRRRIMAAMAELHGAISDPSVNTDRLVEQARVIMRDVDVPVTGAEPAVALEEFLAVAEEPHDWVVPGLLERGDRLILTGGEGQGKSTFLRQMALAISHGCHPFTEVIIEPRRVLVLDAENTDRQLRRALRPMSEGLTKRGYKRPDGFFRIEVRPEGIDLRTPMDVRWVYEQVEAARPDVLVIGPLYKLGAVGNEEEPAKQVIRVLDTIRKRWGPCLLMETHSPHGESGGRRPIRPIGASIWMRWPEFGYGLEADKEAPEVFSWFRPWRGPRDLRDWPKKLERRGGDLPWGAPGTGSGYQPPPRTDEYGEF